MSNENQSLKMKDQTNLDNNNPEINQKQINAIIKANSPKTYKRYIALAIALLIIPILGLGIFKVYTFFTTHEITDDAYVQAHTDPISSRLMGTVLKVLVDDNQKVTKGQLLVKLDPQDYEVKVAQAQAAVESAYWQFKASSKNLPASITQAQGENTQATGNYDKSKFAIDSALTMLAQDEIQIKANQSRLIKAKAKVEKTYADYKRYIPLQKRGVITDQLLDEAKDAYLEAKADEETALQAIAQAKMHYQQSQHNLEQSQAESVSFHGQLTKAKATDMQTEVVKRQTQSYRAQYEQALANLAETKLNLSYTNIIAPENGIVGRKTVETGQRVQMGEALMAVVESPPWIVANFKEIQLEKMQPHQLVEITVDAYKHHKFYGYIDSIAPNSGSQFALLPPDNATGNFTKIVQRVPVKIIFTKESLTGYEDKVVPGLSCVVTVCLNKTYKP